MSASITPKQFSADIGTPGSFSFSLSFSRQREREREREIRLKKKFLKLLHCR